MKSRFFFFCLLFGLIGIGTVNAVAPSIGSVVLNNTNGNETYYPQGLSSTLNVTYLRSLYINNTLIGTLPYSKMLSYYPLQWDYYDYKGTYNGTTVVSVFANETLPKLTNNGIYYATFNGKNTSISLGVDRFDFENGTYAYTYTPLSGAALRTIFDIDNGRFQIQSSLTNTYLSFQNSTTQTRSCSFTASTMNKNQKYRFVFYFNHTIIKIWRDGTMVKNCSIKTDHINYAVGSGGTSIGRKTSGSAIAGSVLNGTLADFYYIKSFTPLTQEEIIQDYYISLYRQNLAYPYSKISNAYKYGLTPIDYLLQGNQVNSTATCVIPIEDYSVNGNVLLCRRNYIFADSNTNGAITFSSSGSKLNCQGAVIIGNNTVGSIGFHNNFKSNLQINNCSLQNYTYGIYMTKTRNNTIKNVNLTYISKYAIELTNCNKTNISSNLITNAVNSLSTTNQAILLVGTSDKNVIGYNKIVGYYNSIAFDGTSNPRYNHTMIFYNNFTDAKCFCLNWANNGLISNYSEIIGNRFIGCGWNNGTTSCNAIDLGGYYHSIHNNYFFNFSHHGIDMYNNVNGGIFGGYNNIYNNIFNATGVRNGAKNAVYIAQMSHNNVYNNTNYHCTMVSEGNYTGSKDNKFYLNKIYFANTSLYGSSDTTFYNNTIYNPVRFTVVISNYRNKFVNVSVTNNKYSNNPVWYVIDSIYSNSKIYENSSKANFSIGSSKFNMLFSGYKNVTINNTNVKVANLFVPFNDVFNQSSLKVLNYNVVSWSGSIGPGQEVRVGDYDTPHLKVVAPRGTYNNTYTPHLNITHWINPVSQCWYSLDGGANTSISCTATTISVPNYEAHTLTVWANHTSGVEVSNTTSFTTRSTTTAGNPTGGGGGGEQTIIVVQPKNVTQNQTTTIVLKPSNSTTVKQFFKEFWQPQTSTPVSVGTVSIPKNVAKGGIISAAILASLLIGGLLIQKLLS